MPALDDSDPILRLCDQIQQLFEGHQRGNVVVALAACLAIALEEAAERGTEPPAGKRLRHELGQLAAQAIYQRPGVRES